MYYRWCCGRPRPYAVQESKSKIYKRRFMLMFSYTEAEMILCLQGRKGMSYTKGCYKFTCVMKKPGRQLNWRPRFLNKKCCSFNQTDVRIGATVDTLVLPDQCTHASVVCEKKEDKADLRMRIEDYCPKKPGLVNVITNTSAIITTPEYPNAYPTNVDECWIRTPSCGHSVQLEFTHFNVGCSSFLPRLH